MAKRLGRVPVGVFFSVVVALTLYVFVEWGPFAQSDAWPDIFFKPLPVDVDGPVHITHAADGSGRIFVVEQVGRIRIIKDGALLPQPFLDITDRVGSGGERGLLSVAFPPGYAEKGHFYVDYTDRAGDTVIARYRLGAGPDQADPASEQVVLAIDQPYANHNGGQLAFGPDGYLYIGMGDGGGGGDPENRAQNRSDLLGKVLRIDVETGSPATYTVPATNPYVGHAAYRPEIWAWGLRNPWRFSFDRQTGDLYIADVGQNSYEEINVQPATSTGGENYGWDIMEASHCYDATTCDQTGLVLPVAEYGRSQGCSVTGGVVYRGDRYPRLWGVYVYGDYCSGNIWGLRQANGSYQTARLDSTQLRITSFGEDEQGNVYLASVGDGKIYELAEAVERFYMPLVLH